MYELYTECPIEIESLRAYLDRVTIWIDQLKLNLGIKDE